MNEVQLREEIVSLTKDYEEDLFLASLNYSTINISKTREESIEKVNVIIEAHPNYVISYIVKSDILLDAKEFQKALETVNEGIGKTDAIELYYQKAKILKEIDVNQAVETYLYIIQKDSNGCACVQACLLTNEVEQMVLYSNWYFDYHPITIDNIESGFAVFAHIFHTYILNPFNAFFAIIEKIDLEPIKKNIRLNTAEEAFYTIWKLIKNDQIKEAIILYSKLFFEVDLSNSNSTEIVWSNPKYPFYGLNHIGYGSYEDERNEFHIRQALPKYNNFEALLKIKSNAIEEVRTIFLNFIRWNIDKNITIIEKEQEWYMSISQYTDRWYIKYENIYIVVNLLAPYLENAIFFIDEMYDKWIDEYKIENGKLYFERNYAEEDTSIAKRKVFEEKALQRPELKNFVSMI